MEPRNLAMFFCVTLETKAFRANTFIGLAADSVMLFDDIPAHASSVPSRTERSLG
jgi:hypothetical protein